jgi:LysR family nitrogen assimilation transcriptional regulator
MRIKQLEYFVKVCEIGSITKAAEALRVAQPALGMQLKAIETELGTQLLVRTPRGAFPTAIGEELIEDFRQILNKVDIVKRKIQQKNNGANRTIALGLTPSLATALSGRLLEAFHKQDPNTRLLIFEDFSHILVDRMRKSTLDLALAYSTAREELPISEPLLRESLYFVASPSSDFGTPGPITFKELSKADFVMSSERDSVLCQIRDMLKDSGSDLHVPYRVRSMTAMKEVICRGMAYGILPLANLARELVEGTLIAREIIDPPITRVLYAISATTGTDAHRDRVLCLVKRLLQDLCRENSNFTNLGRVPA